MYNEMEEFVARRQIFTWDMDAVDFDRMTPFVPQQFGRSSTSPRPTPTIEIGSPPISSSTLNANICSSTATFEKPSKTIPDVDTTWSNRPHTPVD
jgi:hypothetical protein